MLAGCEDNRRIRLSGQSATGPPGPVWLAASPDLLRDDILGRINERGRQTGCLQPSDDGEFSNRPPAPAVADSSLDLPWSRLSPRFARLRPPFQHGPAPDVQPPAKRAICGASIRSPVSWPPQ
jgi:hypothetical protein